MTTVSLRNTSGEALRVNGSIVDADEVIHVDGKLAAKKSQPADAYLIGDGDEPRLWPHAHWSVESKTNDEEND